MIMVEQLNPSEPGDIYYAITEKSSDADRVFVHDNVIITGLLFYLCGELECFNIIKATKKIIKN